MFDSFITQLHDHAPALAVLEFMRGGERIVTPPPGMALEAGDVLRVRADVRRIGELQSRVGVRLQPGMKERPRRRAWTDARRPESAGRGPRPSDPSSPRDSSP